MTQKRSFTVLSSFILKIVAMAAMTFDHIGWMIGDTLGNNFWVVNLFRIIGRLALPLFCFMITEGVLHTKRIGHYFLRLGIMGTLVSLAILLVEYLPMFDGFSVRAEGNIFVDLLLGAIAVFFLKRKEIYYKFFLKRKEIYYKLLCLIPLGIGVASFFAVALESQGILIHWFPFFLRPQYHFYGILMIILFYVAYLLKDQYLKWYSNNSGIPVESLQGTNVDRISANLFAVFMVVFSTLLYFALFFLIPSKWVFWDPYTQNYAILSGAFILLYSGKRGYNAKWFQYGSYLYYPLHLVVIILIFVLVNGGF